MSESAQTPHSGIRVDCVRIANFRSLRNVEVMLSPSTILVGMNNAGKTSFLRALHFALGADRRILSPDDFHLTSRDRAEASEILIDARIVPVNEEGVRVGSFSAPWIDSDFGGSIVSLDAQDRDFIAIRTRVTFDSVKNDFSIERRLLQDWPDFADWQSAPTRGGAVRRFEQLLSFFIDAQRDAVADLRNRSSYIGKLLSKIEISEAALEDLENRLRALNTDIVANSEVLTHMRDALMALNRTVPSFGEGVEVTPVSKKLRDITKGLGVQFNDSASSSFPLEAHGMGTRSWASLLTYQAYVAWLSKQAGKEDLPFHPILTLEEPEAHLHPNAQRCVYEQLRGGYGQQIVSTHSPYIAGQADLADIRHFYKDGNETRVASLDLGGLEREDIRKIRREVMRTRGELLFARAVVLGEGETEEQALPLLAQHHWGQFPFERGVAFIGVGGDGNYLPFLRVFQAMNIPWFIFSDGEANARRLVARALNRFDSDLNDPRLIILPEGMSIEQYLISEGYQAPLKEAALAYRRGNAETAAAEEERDEVMNWTDDELLAFMKRSKTGLSSHWARALIDLNNADTIPSKIKELLNRIDRHLASSPPPSK